MNIVKKLLVSVTAISLIALSSVPVFATSVPHCIPNTNCDPYTMHQRYCDGVGGCILGYEDCANRNAACWQTDVTVDENATVKQDVIVKNSNVSAPATTPATVTPPATTTPPTAEELAAWNAQRDAYRAENRANNIASGYCDGNGYYYNNGGGHHGGGHHGGGHRGGRR